MSLTLAFDIGYASIGWCVLSAKDPAPADPEILGTGVVTFPTDDCLASQRRNLRRTRRHIRSTRQRIERLKRWLQHRGVLSREDLDKPGHPAPFLLAAATLQGHRELTATELWTVLRWYAHNRGYDGNSRWARNESGEEGDDDTQKEQVARSLMHDHGTGSMAETVCKCLQLDPAASGGRISSFLPYKTLDAAYPREIVEREVGILLSKHLDRIPGLDGETARLLLTAEPLAQEQRNRLLAAKIRLPKRFEGGLLFGQLVPRFDNRIISRCPITWAEVYEQELQSGKPEEEARRLAERNSKVPAARAPEFLEYRFARLLANLRANGEPLSAELRQHLFTLAKQKGRLLHGELKKEIQSALGTKDTNLDAFFKIHPDSEKALVLDPAAAIPQSNQTLKPLWPIIPAQVQETALERWRRNRALRLGDLLEQTRAVDPAAGDQLEGAIADSLAKLRAKAKTKDTTFDELLRKTFQPADLSGRAPYARPVLKRVVEQVLEGFDPNKPAFSSVRPDGEKKQQDGVLYPLLDPRSRVRELQNLKPLDKLTNNHLVRHRLLILERLLESLTAEFCAGDPSQVTRCVVEVGRELKEFSGMDAVKIKSEIKNKLKHFKAAVAYLEKFAPHLPLSGSLIRKCRIAIDLGWTCPFTGDTYEATDLPKMEREHIIPYASRNSNALHGLVLTRREVNAMKGKRTARQFILDDGGKPVDGYPQLSLRTIRGYDEAVDRLDTKGHLDDYRRKKARKDLLATTTFDERDQDFTPGQLTQSSHLMKLALRGISLRFPQATNDPIPGAVNAEIRKAWNLTGTLAIACPDIIDPETHKPRPKDEIRGVTHLHHALDASSLALVAHYFPLQYRGQDRKGLIWEALLKRRKTDEQWALLKSLKIIQRDEEGRMRLSAPPDAVKNQLAHRLAECRVMQHVPADRKGAKAELTTWGVAGIVGGDALILQRPNRGGLELDPNSHTRKWKNAAPSKEALVLLERHAELLKPRDRNLVRRGLLKLTTERLSKLLGPQPAQGNGKLKAIRGALILGSNYGMALDPTPMIIPFHAVHSTLEQLCISHGNKPVRVLRNGMLIRLSGLGQRDGIWQITTVQASLKVDLIRPMAAGRPKSGPTVWREVSITSLIHKDLEILPQRYTAYPA